MEIEADEYSGQSSTYSNAPSTLTAEDYFYRAYNAPANSHQFKIDNYDMCINLNYKYKSKAYNNRGNAKSKLKDYYGAITDYTKAIELKPDYANAYNNRGNSKKDLKDHYGAITDYTKAISLNPDFVEAYTGRGICKEILGQPYCSDWKKGCELGNQNCCEWYNNQCR
jgi:tetratricopeptide (TPR) repeat protein